MSKKPSKTLSKDQISKPIHRKPMKSQVNVPAFLSTGGDQALDVGHGQIPLRPLSNESQPILPVPNTFQPNASCSIQSENEVSPTRVRLASIPEEPQKPPVPPRPQETFQVTATVHPFDQNMPSMASSGSLLNPSYAGPLIPEPTGAMSPGSESASHDVNEIKVDIVDE